MQRIIRLYAQDALSAFPSLLCRVVGTGILALVFHAVLVIVFCATILVIRERLPKAQI